MNLANSKCNSIQSYTASQHLTPCFDYSGNFGRLIVHWHRVNWPRNVHLRTIQKCVREALIWLHARFKTHLRGISRVMHNNNNFHAEKESVAGPKNIFPIGFPTAQPKKRCAQGFLAFNWHQINGREVETRDNKEDKFNSTIEFPSGGSGVCQTYWRSLIGWGRRGPKRAWRCNICPARTPSLPPQSRHLFEVNKKETSFNLFSLMHVCGEP